eukprot:gene5011-biopygen4077
MATSHPGPTSTSRLFFVTDKYSGTRFLVDTGADVSVIPCQAIEKGHHNPSAFQLQAVNKSSISTYGERSIALDLGLRRTYRWIFIIVDVQTPILGADFLSHYALKVDVRHRKLTDTRTTLMIQGIRRTLESPRPMFAIPNASLIYHDLLQKFPSLVGQNYDEKAVKHNIRFVPNCAQIVQPLTDLLAGRRPKTALELPDNALAAFQVIKSALATAAMLVHPSPTDPYCLMVDASNLAIGVVLQQHIDGQWKSISFF